ncbi:MAG: hypothetical protein EZS28_008445 [Streblomastix strix]|uniref:Secreted protein n=1 Tax=Streblomastix strix TaxID=222440 RepID=A0A5J4WMZ0_9EUKA|nr:MAG: hypothetical protein EZS28_008445 [Streblomastix strix]
MLANYHSVSCVIFLCSCCVFLNSERYHGQVEIELALIFQLANAQILLYPQVECAKRIDLRFALAIRRMRFASIRYLDCDQSGMMW